jgi:hypothetical protein
VSLVGLGVFFYMDENKCTNNVTLQAEINEDRDKKVGKGSFINDVLQF